MNLRQRSRLVTFRVCLEEYNDLSKWAGVSGARSISEFARAAVLQSVQALRTPSGTLTGDLSTLVRSLADLDAHLSETQKRVRGVLGSARTEESLQGDRGER
jgi:hypothetical protein